MALTEAKKKEWEDALRELELLSGEDCIERHTAGDYWQMGQTRGNFFFTKEKLIFTSGFGISNFAVNYKDIVELKKCFVGPFIPTGVQVIAQLEDGKRKKYKCSLMKRNEWIAFLEEKSGVKLS